MIDSHRSFVCDQSKRDELRSVAAKLESDQLKEFKRIEIAVQNAADMIQQLKAVVKITTVREPI